MGGPVAVSGAVGVGLPAVVRTVDRAVDRVAVLSSGPVGWVVACVTVGPVAVDLGVAVGASGDVAWVVVAKVVRGDPVESRAQNISAPSAFVPFCC